MPRAAPGGLGYCPHMRIVLAVLVLVTLAACAHQPPTLPLMKVPGFWSGLWHGLIAPIAFVVSLFGDARMYAFPNSGVWYDFGFLLGIGVWGGGAAARR